MIASLKLLRSCVAGAFLVLLLLVLYEGSAGAVPLGTINEFRVGLQSSSRPSGLVLASDGDLWFTDGAVIGRITPSGEISEFAESLTAESRPRGLIAGRGGYLWFMDRHSPGHESIGRVSLSGAITEFPLAASSEAYDLGGGTEGDIWFTDRYSGAIGRVTESGEVTYYTAGLHQEAVPGEIVPGPEGDMWFTDDSEGSPAIGRVTPKGEITEFSEGLEIEGKPSSMVLGPDGNLWFGDNGLGKAIGRITPGGEVTLYKGNLGEACSRGCGPGGLINGPEGDLWLDVGAGDGGLIGRITTEGITTEFTPKIGIANSPGSLVSAPDGNLWFPDSSLGANSRSSVIGRMTPAGVFSWFSEGLDPESLGDLAVGSDGNVWFTNGAAIGRISVAEPPAPPPPPPPPSPPKTGHLSIAHSGLAVVRGVATVKLKCTGTAKCVGKLVLFIRVKRGRRTRSKVIDIANTSAFSIAPGTVKAFKIHLRRVGVAKLNASRRGIDCTLVVAQSAPLPAKTMHISIHLTHALKPVRRKLAG